MWLDQTCVGLNQTGLMTKYICSKKGRKFSCGNGESEVWLRDRLGQKKADMTALAQTSSVLLKTENIKIIRIN